MAVMIRGCYHNIILYNTDIIRKLINRKRQSNVKYDILCITGFLFQIYIRFVDKSY